MMTIKSVQEWHKRARPTPDDNAFNVQLGCHLEEIVEMLDALHFTHPKFGTSSGGDMTLFTLLREMSAEMKAGRVKATVVDREAFLDSLADQIVTAVGVGHCAKMDVPEALKCVDYSNWSKFDANGQPVFDANGKIAKPDTYVKPDLTGLY